MGAVILTAAAAQAQTNNTAATSSTKPTSAQTVTTPGGASQTKKTKTTSAHRTSAKSKRSRKTSSRKHGQQKIDAERTREIQEALIREHYFTGEASGVWNDATQKAMQHYQAANGWQSKTTPDARALIKLGLGPDHQHLLNPESAMTADSPAAHAGANATNHVAPSSTSTSADPAKSKPRQ